MSENIYPSVLKKQIIAFLIRKEKEVKKTYSIFKVCTFCKQKKPMVDFPSVGRSKIKKDGTDPKRSMCIPCELKRQRLWKEKHKKRLKPEARDRMNKYRKEKPEKFRDNRLKSRKKQRENLDDGYIKNLFVRKKSSLTWENIPQPLIDAKRELIKLKRAIKERS
ncbi:MAG TPA: hypothetical protein DEP37_13195 [Algoriphagus sp.]|nr:hypothetical protein [Algoriphagus sp.]